MKAEIATLLLIYFPAISFWVFLLSCFFSEYICKLLAKFLVINALAINARRRVRENFTTDVEKKIEEWSKVESY